MNTHSSIFLFGFILLILIALPAGAHAQLLQVEQSVSGMDCAQCADGLEKSMNHMDGVDSAAISLNEGRATLQFHRKNSVTLEAIREAISKNGLSAKDAVLKATGTLTYSREEWVLSLPSGERFRLGHMDTEELNSRDGQQITVTGHVPKGKKPSGSGWALHVSNMDPRG